MSGQDFLSVETQIDDQNLEVGEYEIRGLGEIGATYSLVGNTLTVLDDGDLSGATDESIMIVAPNHFAVKNSTFSGDIRCDRQTLHITNNKVVSVT